MKRLMPDGLANGVVTRLDLEEQQGVRDEMFAASTWRVHKESHRGHEEWLDNGNS